MLLLLFSVTGNVVFTFLFGWSVTQLTVYLYSFGIGCFHGTIFRGQFIRYFERVFVQTALVVRIEVSVLRYG